MAEEKRESKQTIPGSAKAGMLIRMLETETARKIIKILDEEEQEKLAQEIAKNTEYTKEEYAEVMTEYLFYLKSKNAGTFGNGIEYLRKLFSHLSDSEFQKMLGKIYYDTDNPLEFLKNVKDIEPLVAVLGKEDTQTIALVCNYLEPKLAGQLLQSLPEEKMIETITAIAKLDQVDSELVAKIGKAVETQLNKMSMGELNQQEGIKSVVNILNNVPRNIEKTVLDRLETIDKELSEIIRENLFTFDDLISVDNLTLQRILNEIQDMTMLAKAMKTASEELKEKLYQSMSAGRKEMLQEIFDGMGPIRMKEVEKAQQDIAYLVKQLEREGKIQLARGDDDVIL